MIPKLNTHEFQFERYFVHSIQEMNASDLLLFRLVLVYVRVEKRMFNGTYGLGIRTIHRYSQMIALRN